MNRHYFFYRSCFPVDDFTHPKQASLKRLDLISEVFVDLLGHEDKALAIAAINPNRLGYGGVHIVLQLRTEFFGVSALHDSPLFEEYTSEYPLSGWS